MDQVRETVKRDAGLKKLISVYHNKSQVFKVAQNIKTIRCKKVKNNRSSCPAIASLKRKPYISRGLPLQISKSI